MNIVTAILATALCGFLLIKVFIRLGTFMFRVVKFRKYLWQWIRSKSPRASWATKETGALVGFSWLVASGIAFTFFPLSWAHDLFLLLFIGCPFLWIYADYCNEEAKKEKQSVGGKEQ